MEAGMTGDRRRATYVLSCCGALLLAPALAAAQDQVPVPPPKQETVTIRAVDGSFELKGTSSADAFEFTQQCEARQGYSESVVSLTLPLDIEGGPNGALESATALLRAAVAKGLLTTVESSDDTQRPTRVMIAWSGGLPSFMGVIESVGMKYTMFLPSGTPVRATARLKFKEADRASFKQGRAGETDQPDSKKKSDCSSPKH
jgi:hypothetical protein